MNRICALRRIQAGLTKSGNFAKAGTFLLGSHLKTLRTFQKCATFSFLRVFQQPSSFSKNLAENPLAGNTPIFFR
jgi:hypothetical protein